MKIALAQIDTINGDISGNAERILQAMDEAQGAGADLCIFPELAVTGYACYDLLLRPGFVNRAVEATRAIAHETGDMAVILGTVEPAGTGPDGSPGMRNVAAVLQHGRILTTRAKTLLPAYNVFHEPRYFRPASRREPVDLAGRRLGILICEDMWDAAYDIHPAAELKAAGADLLIVLSASPYRSRIMAARIDAARRHGMPIVYVNGAGAQDELIFDGGSFALNDRGEFIVSLPRFRESVTVVDTSTDCVTPDDLPENEEMFTALVSGIRGFAEKNGLRKAYVGLSGGIDSALAACLAAEAIGPENVHALTIPSRFTDPRSTEAARELTSNLGISMDVIPLEPLHSAALSLLDPMLEEEAGTTAENIQCRLRSMILMAHVNRHGGMLLNTSNKTELSLGYGTLYGDLAGALSPLGDLIKTDVYKLAGWYNRKHNAIPRFILQRAPSAELRPGQMDPFDYPRIAPFVEAMVEGAGREEMLRMGATDAEIQNWDALMRNAEHKRWQAPVILKVRPVSFGRGRLVPITGRPATAMTP